MRFIKFFLLFGELILICFGSAKISRGNRIEILNSANNQEAFEHNHSLLDDPDELHNFESEEIYTFQDDATENRVPEHEKRISKSKSRKLKLPPGYNKLEIPKVSMAMLGEAYRKTSDEVRAMIEETDGSSSGEDAVIILVDVSVRNIKDIDEFNEEITVEMDYVAKWIDPVLFFEYEHDAEPSNSSSESFLFDDMHSLDPVILNSIWKPDLFIERAVAITRPRLITKPIRVLISPAGLIMLSTRVTLTMDCEMEFYYFPADTQTCVFKIRSYSHTTKDLIIGWDKPGPFLLDRYEHNFDVKLDLLESTNLEDTEYLVGPNETFRILQFQISARRKMSFHLLQTYLPSACFIITAWLSFLVPATMVEARAGISMTTLLTLVSMFSTVRENTPIVSYIRAIDIWMQLCIILVFLTLLELTILTWRRHLAFPISTAASDVGNPRQENKEQYDDIDTTGKSEQVELRNQRRQQNPELSSISLIIKGFSEQQIENYSFVVSFVIFIVFNLIYWPWLLISSGYFHWTVDYTYNVKDE